MDMKVKHDPTKKLRDIAFGSSAERGLFAMEARHFKVSSDSLSQ